MAAGAAGVDGAKARVGDGRNGAAAAGTDSEHYLMRIKGLVYTYSEADTPAISVPELKLSKREVIGLAGSSGSGKTTLIRCINGLAPHHFGGTLEGNIEMWVGRGGRGDDLSPETPASRARHIATLFQEPGIGLVSTSVEEELAFGLENLAVPRDIMVQRVEEQLRNFNVADLRDRPPANLSGGQKQMVGLAAAVVTGPRLLLLDEPTAELDTRNREMIARALDRVRGSMTVLMAEHDAYMLSRCDRIVWFEDGVLRGPASPDEFFARDGLLRELGLRGPPSIRISKRLRNEGIDCPVTSDPAGLRSWLDSRLSVSAPSGSSGYTVRRGRKRKAAGAPKKAPGGAHILEARDISHTYPDGTAALRGISMGVNNGETLGIIGANGSGKSTLARIMCGLLDPTEGKITGASKSDDPPRASMVFQDPDLSLFSDSVLGEIMFTPLLKGEEDEGVKEEAAGLLEAVGLGPLRDRHPFSLSRGERQRLAVAAALASHPGMLVLDEPSKGLDHRNVSRMWKAVRQSFSHGTLVVVTNDLELAARCGRLVVLKGGRVHAAGAAQEVLSDARLLKRAGLIPPEWAVLSFEMRAHGLRTQAGSEAEFAKQLAKALAGRNGVVPLEEGGRRAGEPSEEGGRRAREPSEEGGRRAREPSEEGDRRSDTSPKEGAQWN